MAYTYLQSFLDARLFTIAEDNSTYQFLTTTIPVFEKSLIKTRVKIIASTLVALDQEVPQDDPILDEVEELLKKKWQLLRNKYTERPRTLLRAIILEALYSIAKSDAELASIIWLTGSNYFQFVIENGETTLLKDWLNEIGSVVERHATIAWSLVENVKTVNIPAFSMGKIQLSGVTLDKAGMQVGLAEAVNNGHHITQNTNQNYNSLGNIRAEWVNEFSTKSAEILFKVFSGGIISVNNAFNNLQLDKPINDFFTAFKDDLTKTLTAVYKSTEKLNLRSSIIWWKEALYSQSARLSYREMEHAEMSAFMAKDLASMIPPVYPIAVDFILKETLKECVGEAPKKAFADLLSEFTVFSIEDQLDKNPDNSGRISISAFLQLLVSQKENVSNFKGRTGVDPALQISYADLAVIFLHDIQANKISAK